MLYNMFSVLLLCIIIWVIFLVIFCLIIGVMGISYVGMGNVVVKEDSSS